MHIGHDGIDILGFFLDRIGVVHPNVAEAIELVCDPEVQADRLGMPDMKITVGLRWKAGDNPGVFSGSQIFRHDVADKIGGSWRIGGFVHANFLKASERRVDRQLSDNRAKLLRVSS